MRLRKYHGLGNDYLVLETADPLSAALVVALCDRHRGPGADGVLEPLPIRRDPASGRPLSAYALRIWNPDGSLAEKSGNGLRILARWLRDHRAAPPAFGVEVRLDAGPGALVSCQVAPPVGVGEVEVEMGIATVGLLDAPIQVAGQALRHTVVDLGNPHCVVFFASVAELDAAPWRTLGAALELHPAFPRRTNVQFAAPTADPAVLEARIWERGAGETQASGSSACAVAVAAGRRGLAPGAVRVQMPGGSLAVQVDAEGAVRLRGPVEEIGVVEPSPGWLVARRAGGRL